MKNKSSLSRYRRSCELSEEAKRFAPGGAHSDVHLHMEPFPLFFARAEGSHWWDVDGREYVDYALGMGPVILRHAHAGVNHAVAARLSKEQLYAGQHEEEVALARLVCEVVPIAEMVGFSLCGSEAMQATLCLAPSITGQEARKSSNPTGTNPDPPIEERNGLLAEAAARSAKNPGRSNSVLLDFRGADPGVLAQAPKIVHALTPSAIENHEALHERGLIVAAVLLFGLHVSRHALGYPQRAQGLNDKRYSTQRVSVSGRGSESTSNSSGDPVGKGLCCLRTPR